jgi:hypothetical protein
MRPTWVPGGYFFIHIVACEWGGELKFCTFPLYIYIYIMSTAVFVLFWQNWDAFAIFLTVRCKASCTLDWAI